MKKLIVRLLNIGYLVGTAVALVGITTQPLAKVDLSLGVPGQFISDFVVKQLDKDSSKTDKTTEVYLPKITRENVDTEQFDLVEILKDVDFNGVFEGLTIDVTVELPSFVKFMGKTDEQKTAVIADSIKGAIKNTKESVAGVLSDGLMKLVPEVAKTAATTVITDTVADKIKEVLGADSIEDEAVKEQVAKIEATVSEMVEDVWDELNSGEATVDSVFDIVEENINDVFEVLAETDPSFADVTVSTEQLNEIKEQMTEMLQEVGLTDEDGNITDIEAALATMLEMFMGNKTDNEEEEKEEKTEAIRVHRAETADDEELKQKISDFIDELMKELPLDKIEGINLDELTHVNNMTLYAYAGLTVLIALPWLLFMLVTIIRTIRPNKCWTKPWIIFVFAFLELILGVVLLCVCKYGLPFILGKLGSVIPADYAGLLSGEISLGIKLQALWPSIVYLAMIPYSIVYAIFARGAKKQFKQFKKEKKAAKKAA